MFCYIYGIYKARDVSDYQFKKAHFTKQSCGSIHYSDIAIHYQLVDKSHLKL